MRTSRTIAVTAASLLALGLAGCGDQGGTTASGSGTGTAVAGATDSSTSQSPTSTDSSTAAPSMTDNGKARAPLEPKNIEPKTKGIVANPDGPVTNVLDVYADPQCPFCAEAEKVTSESIEKAVKAKTVRVVFHPMNFLDQRLQNDSSSKMANALVCASDAPGKLLPFLREMYAVQPTEEGKGYAADAPKTIADKIGLTGAERTAFDECVSGSTYAPWIDSAQTQYTKDGVQSTPTYKLNGEKVDLAKLDKAAFEKKLAGGK